jgi:hypothetical protein
MSLQNSISDRCAWECGNCLYAFQNKPVRPKSMVASSKNILTYEAFVARAQPISSDVDNKLKAWAQKCGFQWPTTVPRAPMTDHCVSLSLNFIKNYNANGRIIENTAQQMSCGATTEQANSTRLYEALIQFNGNLAKNSPDQFLFDIRNVVAKTLGFHLTDKITLKMTPEEIYSHIIGDQLAQGEYVVPLPNHLTCIVKNSSGVYIYDCNCGTVKLGEENKEWFLNLLRRYKIDIVENFTLIKTQERIPEQEAEAKETTFVSPLIAQQATLKYTRNTRSRWGVAEFNFRNKIYHFPYDQKTGLIYNNNSKGLVRFKFILLTFRNVIDTTCRTVYHIGKTVFCLLALFFCKRSREDIGELIRSFLDIFRAPFYGFLQQWISIYGIVSPYEGRRIYGEMERALNRHSERIDFREKYYVAPCFVPINSSVNGKGESEQIEVLKRYCLRLESYNKNMWKDLFLNWTRNCC